MEAPFLGNSRPCLYRIILWPVVTGKYPVPEYYFLVQLFREIMWKMAIYRPYFDTSGSRKSQIFKFSLIISLLAGNRAQRQVHSRLHPPPTSLAFGAFSPTSGEKAAFAGDLGAFSLRHGAEVQRETVSTPLLGERLCWLNLGSTPF